MSDLKKVGLIYKADGQADFVKSLKSVNAELRENYQNMNLTQASWDKNTKASDKLRDRLVNLQQAYDLNGKKLRVLNEELKELEKNENATEAEINSKKAAIKQTEAEMQRYQNRIEGVNEKLKSGTADIEAYGKKLQDTGKKIEDVGKKASIFSAAYVGAMGLAVKKASDWESAWIDVLKVTDGTEKQLDDLSKSIRKMSQELPVSANEIAGVVEAASKLGVGVEYVEDFAETMVKMEIATGISASDSATAIARFAEITRMSMDDVGRLGSVIAHLGDNFATTEKEIIDMSMGLAAAGSQVGMSQSDIMALATALSSVGLEAQAGGSAMSKLMVNMELATKTGEGLTEFANVASVSGGEFARIFEEDATGALSMFIKGLDNINKDGGSAIKTLDDMGIKEVRLRDTLLRAANASDTFTGAIEEGSRAWEENTKLTEEAELQADTLANQWQLTKNMMEEIAITFGEIVIPVLKDFLHWIQGLLESFQNLSPVIQKSIVVIGALLAAVGPLLIFIGKLISAVGIIVSKWGTVITVGAKIGGVLTKIGGIIAALNPIVIGIGVVVAGVAVLIYKNWNAIKEWTLNLVETLKNLFGNFIEWFKSIWTGLKDFVINLWTSIKDGTVGIWESLKEITKNVFNSIGEFFVGLWDSFVEMITNFVNRMLEIFNWPIEFIKNAILLVTALFAMWLENIYNNFILPVVEFFRNAIDTIVEFFSSMKEKIAEIVAQIVIFLVQKVQEGLEKIKDFFTTIFTWISDNVIQPFADFFNNVFNKVGVSTTKIVEGFKFVFKTGFDWIKTTVISPLTNFFSGVFDSISNVITNAITTIRNGFSAVGTFITTMFQGIRDTVVNIFSVISGVIKAPINGIIGIVNGVLSSLNKIKIPSWVPGLGGVGINFPTIPMMYQGGNLLGSSAIVGDRGPELLTQSRGRSTVTPLTSSGGVAQHDLIDYNKLSNSIMKGLSSVHLIVDENGIAKFVDDRLLEVL